MLIKIYNISSRYFNSIHMFKIVYNFCAFEISIPIHIFEKNMTGNCKMPSAEGKLEGIRYNDSLF